MYGPAVRNNKPFVGATLIKRCQGLFVRLISVMAYMIFGIRKKSIIGKVLDIWLYLEIRTRYVAALIYL